MTLTALILWPVIMIILCRTLPWPQALVISIVGGYLLLPEEGMWFDPVLLPPIDKQIIPSAMALALALMFRPGTSPGFQRTGQSSAPDAYEPRPGFLPSNTWALLGLSMVLLGMVATALANGDVLRFSLTDYTRPALRLYDGIALAVAMLPMVLPFLLGRKYLAQPEHHRTILWIIAIAGLLYTLPALWEIRMSPRLNVQLYGFFPHNWQQHVRGGGFRPIVFLPHGLFLALFFALVATAFFALARSEKKHRGLLYLGGIWVLTTLALSNSLTGLVVALALCPVVLLLGRNLQLTAAAAIAILILLYPSLRMTDLVPTDRAVQIAESINPARGASLNYRFENEELILDHVRERPLLGWGGYGRNRIYDERGRGVDTVDSSWIVSLGTGGWVQFLGLFGLLATPLLLLWKHRKDYEVTLPTTALCLLIAGNMLDLIVNSGLTPVTWLIAGALFGRLELKRVAESSVSPVPAESSPSYRATIFGGDSTLAPTSRYTRQKTMHIRTSPGKHV